eukprot:gene11707-biopygen13948
MDGGGLKGTLRCPAQPQRVRRGGAQGPSDGAGLSIAGWTRAGVRGARATQWPWVVCRAYPNGWPDVWNPLGQSRRMDKCGQAVWQNHLASPHPPPPHPAGDTLSKISSISA